MAKSTATGRTAVANIRLARGAATIAPFGPYSHVAVHNGVAHVSGRLPLHAAGSPAADEPSRPGTPGAWIPAY
ncbi:hypothetical protein [Streptomyces aureus]|uniref:hypothetical protein n=1 Tax=Streptomyces aureus TaxID=193461 RepID=UPI0006E1867E|nr:hypothetical protein [Streptomyces aureus]